MSTIPASSAPRIAVIGGGPAGLMAAEVLAGSGCRVDLFDAMPSVARKFLLAGKGGMNITHAEPYDRFSLATANAAKRCNHCSTPSDRTRCANGSTASASPPSSAAPVASFLPT